LSIRKGISVVVQVNSKKLLIGVCSRGGFKRTPNNAKKRCVMGNIVCLDIPA